jgi:tetratricopeptide (TPR) repeat protein
VERLGEKHPKTLAAAGNLALSYWHEGRFEEVLEIAKQFPTQEELQLRSLKRTSSPEYGRLMESYADRKVNTFLTASEECWKLGLEEEVLRLISKRIGADDHEEAEVMQNIAVSFYDFGRRDEAVSLGKKVLRFSRRKLGLNHPETLIAMEKITDFSVNPNYLQRWIIREMLLENEYGSLIMTWNHAASLSNSDRLEESFWLFSKVFRVIQDVLGSENQRTLLELGEIARSYSFHARQELALRLENQTLQAIQKWLGPRHSDTLRAIGKIANSYSNVGRLHEAATFDEEALIATQESFGPEHHETRRSVWNLAASYFELIDEKEQFYDDTLRGRSWETVHLEADFIASLGVVRNLIGDGLSLALNRAIICRYKLKSANVGSVNKRCSTNELNWLLNFDLKFTETVKITLAEIAERSTANINCRFSGANFSICGLSAVLQQDPTVLSISGGEEWAESLSSWNTGTMTDVSFSSEIIFEWDDRWYAACFIKKRLNGYSRPNLDRAMLEFHYLLKSRVELLVLHRHLRANLAHYNPMRHLGGVAYFFVRGFPSEGVWFDGCTPESLESLERLNCLFT